MNVRLKASPVVPRQAFAPVTNLGMILLSTDLTTERDFASAFAGTSTAVYGTRIPFLNPTTPENLRATLPELTRAAALLPEVPLRAIGYSCTAASVELSDAVVRDTINAARPDVPVVTPISAVETALTALNARRLAVLTPYLRETCESMYSFFTGRGFELSDFQYLGMSDDGDMARLDPAAIVEAAIALDVTEADAVFISCTALPALGVIPHIEQALGRPVVSSNQAMIWRMAVDMPKPIAATRLGAVAPPALTV